MFDSIVSLSFLSDTRIRSRGVAPLKHDCCCSGAKCDRGCKKGGVCKAVKYDCVCSRGFYKKGDQCIEGRQWHKNKLKLN